MLFFSVQRAIFLFYYLSDILNADISISEFFLTFFHAVQLDISTVCYILVLPSVLVFFASIWPEKIFEKINKVYSLVIILLVLFISVGELGLYKEWNAKLSYKALVYLKNPAEVLASAKTSDIIVYSVIILVQLILFGFLYNKYIYSKGYRIVNQSFKSIIIYLILIPVFLFLGMRGGVGEIPITASQSYFSRHNILNLAAVNPAYNLTFSALDYYMIETSNHFHFMPDDEARKIVEELHHVKTDSTIRIFNIRRPNIVIIFLESWSGDLIESLGGLPGLTPQFHELEKEGVFFTNFFAIGNRSQQALASVFSGFPAIPITTLTDHPQKYGSVSSMVRTLNSEGYYSSFYFGGDLNYGNIKSYLVFNEFDKLVDENDFSSDAIKGKLGIHDEFLFNKMIDELGEHERPFLTGALTLSSHSPYDQPGDRPITNIEFASEYVNSAWYTDKCLGDFIRKAKNTSWYDSTVIIIMSDHSHISYNNYQWWSFDYRRIPLLFLGGAIKENIRGTINPRIASNMDITSTLLRQLGLSDEDYFWSKNLFNPYAPRFAYFELNDGFGWKTPQGRLEYNVLVPMVLSTDLKKDQIADFKKEGEAYIQVLFQEFLDY